MRPVAEIGYQECGERYQEQPAQLAAHEIPSCHCGLFSVGKCVTCQRFVCGSHGTSLADGFFCPEHSAEILAAHRTRLIDEANEAKRKAETARNEQINKLRRLGDSHARLCAALQLLCERRGYDIYARSNFSILVQACSDVWSRRQDSVMEPDLNVNPVWDSRSVALWFAGQALRRGVAATEHSNWPRLTRSFWGRLRVDYDTQEPVWVFPNGSTRINGGRSGTDRPWPAKIFPDGRLDLGPARIDCANETVVRPADEGAKLRGIALVRMAELLGLSNEVV